MNKRNFIALADALKKLRPVMDEQESIRAGASEDFYPYRQGVRQQWLNTVQALAHFCQSQKPSFDRQRWLDYINEDTP